MMLLQPCNGHSGAPCLLSHDQSVPPPETAATEKRNTNSRRRVKFSKNVIKVPCENKHQDVQLEERWYAPQEYAEFKRRFKEDAKQVAKGPAPTRGALLQVFYHCETRVEDPLYMDDKTIERIITFLQNPRNNGLTNMAAREIFQGKRLRRKQLYHKVKQLQKEDDKLDDMSEDSLPFLTPSTDEVIREACEAISRPSTVFALLAASQRQE